MLPSAPLQLDRRTVDTFDSGEPELDSWLRSHAAGSDERRITRTFVWTEYDSTRVIGYYSLMAHQLIRDALPKSIGRGSPDTIPAILLARLALDKSHQGSGNGAGLLGDAMERAAVAAANVGARFLVVDALHDQAAAFYQHFGFKRIPATLRLVQKVSSILASIERA
ncbi:MAG: GNAT family N-acetyltransferase [Actinomycetota bacterium]|nr:GNAT family N-acetyltransferase [Actinomycetota bacterium]